MKSWRIVAVLLLCLVLVGSMGCKKEETSYQLVEVVRSDLTVSVSGGGNIGVSREVKLTFGSNGKIDKIYAKEGDKVTEGEVLVKLETAPLELALAQAQITLVQIRYSLDEAEYNLDQAEYNLDQSKYSLDEAEYNLDVTEMRHSLDLVSNAILDMAEERVRMAEEKVRMTEERVRMAEEGINIAEPQIEAAEQALEEAQKQLDRATITAPFDGIVADIAVDEGDTVSASKSIVHLIDLNSMELKVEVDEIDIPDVELEQRAIIEVDALPALKLEGKVSSISTMPTMEAGLVAYEVTIDLDNPEGSNLKVGMSATADIIINERSNVLLVPARAVTHDSQGNPIVKVMVNEQIQERAVVIGISDGLDTLIVSGLQEGEMVVIETRPKTTSPGGLFGG